MASMFTFNINDGFAEAVVRGMKLGFLTDAEYTHLKQCEKLDDLKANLAETDYGNLLQNVPGAPGGAIIETKCMEKLARDFNFLRASAVEPLASFLEFVRLDFMIENVIKVLRAVQVLARNNQHIDVDELLATCNPLGMFDEAAMRSLAAFEPTPAGYMELYETVLVDTPVGKYFSQFLLDQTADSSSTRVDEVLQEVAFTFMKEAVRKYYLEDFYNFCRDLGGETAAIMCSLLEERADQRTIQIVYNSIGRPLAEEHNRKERKALFPSFGKLPDSIKEDLSKVKKKEELGEVLARNPQYSAMWQASEPSETVSLTSMFMAREVELCEYAFDGQFHYGCFYAYVRLKEREAQNLRYIAEAVRAAAMTASTSSSSAFSRRWRLGGGARRVDGLMSGWSRGWLDGRGSSLTGPTIS
eukprot:CAMPEP_0196781222 /NCGR_PEP_ID=MMETSP1104-20130614/9296_1 /TAXON_ID=33652 /ORGANISM="Cafeteria sp., Strain Caron Lab Isolate" /LENGTH=413 /DNA_ID=CAMNT_0042151443 /DNA_START=31 /DNA_END=1270 /DNA_ORIENTATION=+